MFVIACDSVALRELMLVAHSRGMTNGDYVFVYYEGFRGIEIGDISWRKGNTNDNVNIIIICVTSIPSWNAHEWKINRIMYGRSTHFVWGSLNTVVGNLICICKYIIMFWCTRCLYYRHFLFNNINIINSLRIKSQSVL